MAKQQPGNKLIVMSGNLRDQRFAHQTDVLDEGKESPYLD